MTKRKYEIGQKMTCPGLCMYVYRNGDMGSTNVVDNTAFQNQHLVATLRVEISTPMNNASRLEEA